MKMKKERNIFYKHKNDYKAKSTRWAIGRFSHNIYKAGEANNSPGHSLDTCANLHYFVYFFNI